MTDGAVTAKGQTGITLTNYEADRLIALLFDLACRQSNLVPSTASDTLWDRFTRLLGEAGLDVALVERAPFADRATQERVDVLYDVSQIAIEDVERLQEQVAQLARVVAAAQAVVAVPEPPAEPDPVVADVTPEPEPAAVEAVVEERSEYASAIPTVVPDAWVDEPRPDRDPYPEGPAPKRHPTPPPQDPVAATKAEYVCTTCGRTFDRRNTRRMHQRTHERGGVQGQVEATFLRDREVARTVADRVREREGAVDVIAAREADERSHHERARAKAAERSHHERARAKAAETWARTHAEQAS